MAKSTVKGGGPNGKDGFSNSVEQGHKLERISQAMKVRAALIKGQGADPDSIDGRDLMDATNPSKHKKSKF